MVKDLRLRVLGAAAVFFICIYVIRVLLIRKEGFEDKPPTAKQIEFFKEVWEIPVILSLITDQNSPTSKKLTEAAVIVQSLTQNVKPEDIDYAKVINAKNAKYNEDRMASTAYRIAKSVKIPNQYDKKYKGRGRQDRELSEDFTAATIEIVKKIHKKMPSYPFSEGAVKYLKEESKKKVPKMEDCKGYFKCSGIEKIPKSLD